MAEDTHYFRAIAAAYPALGKKIEFFWGHQELIDLLFDLQNDTRNHTRQGFPLEVLIALHELEIKHKELYPQLDYSGGSKWRLNGR
jgi:hypothetical protein